MSPIETLSLAQRTWLPADAKSSAAAKTLNGTLAGTLGEMPEWNLDDLYEGPDAPEVAADIKRCAELAKALQDNYQGKLVAMAEDGAALASAISDYETLSELMSKLGTYAGLYYSGDQSDGARAKFYGDTIEALTAIGRGLIFVELELNQIDEAVLAKAYEAPR